MVSRDDLENSFLRLYFLYRAASIVTGHTLLRIFLSYRLG